MRWPTGSWLRKARYRADKSEHAEALPSLVGGDDIVESECELPTPAGSQNFPVPITCKYQVYRLNGKCQELF